jgi:hypothetical protein
LKNVVPAILHRSVPENHCGWPRLGRGLKGRKKAKKVEIFNTLEIFSKFEVQKLNVCACLTRLQKLDKRKK